MYTLVHDRIINVPVLTDVNELSLTITAITEEEYYGTRRDRRDKRGSQVSGADIRVPSSPPSPQSLQQTADPDYNPHRKLTNVSSLSAPEVNKVRNVCNNCIVFGRSEICKSPFEIRPQIVDHRLQTVCKPVYFRTVFVGLG